jgi:protein TonB
MSPLTRAPTARRPTFGLAIVLALHVAFVYALMAGIGSRPPLPAEPMKADVILDRHDPLPPDPPQRPDDPTPRAIQNDPIPEPHLVIDNPPDAITNVVPEQFPSSTSGSGEVIPQIIPARVDPRRPLSQPPYPPAEIRANHEGALTLRILVRADGRVADARVAASSGYPLLDEAAVIEAKRRWRLLPATRGNQAVEDWTSLRVVFRLDQR